MPDCLKHVKEVVQTVDRAYSDLQLQPVLEQECALDEEFRVAESGFDQEDACKKFAKHLVDARMEELKTGSQTGYEQFCQRYYEHKGGTVPEEGWEPREPEEPREAARLDGPREGAASKAEAPGGAAAAEPEARARDAPAAGPSSAPKAGGRKQEKKEKKLGKFPIVPVAAVVGGIATFVLVGLLLRSMKRGS